MRVRLLNQPYHRGGAIYPWWPNSGGYFANPLNTTATNIMVSSFSNYIVDPRNVFSPEYVNLFPDGIVIAAGMPISDDGRYSFVSAGFKTGDYSGVYFSPGLAGSVFIQFPGASPSTMAEWMTVANATICERYTNLFNTQGSTSLAAVITPFRLNIVIDAVSDLFKLVA